MAEVWCCKCLPRLRCLLVIATDQPGRLSESLFGQRSLSLHCVCGAFFQTSSSGSETVEACSRIGLSSYPGLALPVCNPSGGLMRERFVVHCLLQPLWIRQSVGRQRLRLCASVRDPSLHRLFLFSSALCLGKGSVPAPVGRLWTSSSSSAVCLRHSGDSVPHQSCSLHQERE